MNYRCLALLFALAVTGNACAFNVDGFRTGMSVGEVAAVARAQGWLLVPSSLMPGLYAEAHEGKNRKVVEVGPANFSFRDGGLVAYTRSLDFDTEYAMKLQELIGKYGSQPQVKVGHPAWGGPGGGYITEVTLTWKAGRDRVDLEFSPEMRSGRGALKSYRGASLSYFTKAIPLIGKP